MWSEVFFEPEQKGAGDDGLTIGLRLPWYQSLPLSVISIDSLAIDGCDMANDQITFTVNGQTRPLAAMAELTGEYWFITDTMTLLAPAPLNVPGNEHTCEVRMSFYPPHAAALRRVCHAQLPMGAARQ